MENNKGKAKTKVPRHVEVTRLSIDKTVLQEEEEVLPAPPDGGYGWVIVFASFMCNMVVDGIGYSFGILLPELIKEYGSTKSKTALVGSLLPGTTMLVGPLVSVVVNKFGCRTATIVGSIIASAAMVLSTFCPTVDVLLWVYGVMGGIGCGLMYLPAVVCVGYYFESKRSLATGIAVCGSGVGTFAFAPLASALVNSYGWTGTNLAMGGIALFCVIFGALMKPLEYNTAKEKNLVNGHDANGDAKKNTSDAEITVTQFTSKMSITSKRSNVVQPFARKDVLYTGSVMNLKEFQSQKSLNDYRHSIHNIAVKSNKSGKASFLASLLDISLLRNPAFLLCGLSNLLGMAALYVPFVYIVDCAVTDGIDAGKAALLISAIGILNTIVRIVLGYIADFPQINPLLVNNICLAVAAISVGIAPFCHTYTAYLAMSSFFAISTAGFIALTSIILVDLVGLEKLTNSFGLIILFRGAAACVGTPLAGILRDMTDSYTVPFFVAGALFGLSSLISFMIPVVQRLTKTKKQIQDDEAMVPMNTKNQH